MKLNQSIGLKC